MLTWYRRKSDTKGTQDKILQKDRAVAIKDFYRKTIELQRTFQKLIISWGPTGDYPPKPIPDELIENVEEYKIKSEEIKIYFDERINKLILGFVVGFNQIIKHLTIIGDAIRRSDLLSKTEFYKWDNDSQEVKAEHIELINGKEEMKNAYDLMKDMQKILDELLEIMQREFRMILGVE